MTRRINWRAGGAAAILIAAFAQNQTSVAQTRLEAAPAVAVKHAYLEKVRAGIAQIARYRARGALSEAQALSVTDPHLVEFASPLGRAVRQVGDARLEAELYHELGLLNLDLGYLVMAREYLTEALAVPRLADHMSRAEIAAVKLALGRTDMKSGEVAAARGRFIEIVADSALDQTSDVVLQAQHLLFMVDAAGVRDGPPDAGALGQRLAE